MRNRNKIRFEIVSLVCALLLVVLSAIPLFSRSTDAKLLGLIIGSFGTGVMLSNLLRSVRKTKGKDK